MVQEIVCENCGGLIELEEWMDVDCPLCNHSGYWLEDDDELFAIFIWDKV